MNHREKRGHLSIERRQVARARFLLMGRGTIERYAALIEKMDEKKEASHLYLGFARPMAGVFAH